MPKTQRKKGLGASRGSPPCTGARRQWDGGEGKGWGSSFRPRTSGRPVGGSFLCGEALSSSCQKQKGRRNVWRLVPRGCDWSRREWHVEWRGPYRLGRSCRSFFTQGASGSTQTLSRLFSLILDNTRGFGNVASPSSSGAEAGRVKQPSPPALPIRKKSPKLK